MQPEGNFVVYDSDEVPVFFTPTDGNPGAGWVDLALVTLLLG